MSEPKSITCTRLSEVMGISHDSVNRFLLREAYEARDLFNEAARLLNLVPCTRNILDNLSHQRLADVGPAKRLGERLVKEGDEVEEALFERLGGRKAPTPEPSPGQDSEPNLDRVEPSAVPGGIDEPDTMRGILEKGGPRGHVGEDSRLSLAAKFGVDGAALGDEFHQAGRLMGVERITDEAPFAVWIGVHGGGDVGHEVRLGAGVADGGSDYKPGGDLEMGDQSLSTVAFVRERHGLGMAGLHRVRRVDRLYGLDAGF